MKVSIITLTNNSQKNIKRCLESIASQNYKDIEHIIIDNNSSDNTKKIIEDYPNKNIKLISEIDNGIYDGWNKGFKMASGDIIGTVMADDLIYDSKTIDLIIKTFKKNSCDIVYGDMNFFQNGKTIRKWKAGLYKNWKFYLGWMPPPPTVYMKKNIIKENKLFNLKLKIASDYEFFLRLFFLKKYKIKYLDKYIYCLEYGGVSNRSIKNIIKSNIECYKAWKLNGLFITPHIIITKPLFKVFQISDFNFFIKKYFFTFKTD